MNLTQSREIRWQQIGAVAIAVAGMIYLIIAPGYWLTAPIYCLFIVLAGLAELTWAAIYARRPSLNVGVAGLLLTIWLLVLWGISRVLPAPFSIEPGSIDAAGLAAKLAEVVGLLALAVIMFQYYAVGSGRPAAWRALAGVAVIGIVLGALGYGAARASEPYFPALVAAPPSPEVALAQDDWPLTDEAAAAAAKPVSASMLEENSGMQVKLIAVTMLGGMIDFRFKVLDEAKVDEVIHNRDRQPKLVAEDSGTVLTLTQEHYHKYEMKEGNTYFLFYTNRQNAIRPGTPVSVVIGDMRLEHLTAQ
ncbi:MAG: hypothetical protein FOGNACKC_05154 [Anaerolineae bacterium]|nr:hypothetical protein [Anaerolineae bacterium]